MQTNKLEFDQKYLETKIQLIIHQINDKDCQRVEFLRGMMAAYCELIENQGWNKKEIKIIFEEKERKVDFK
jgi:hypothetical protein